MKILVLASSSQTLKKLESILANTEDHLEGKILITSSQKIPNSIIKLTAFNIRRLPNDKFSSKNLSQDLKMWIVDDNFDRVYILFNNIFISGYKNVISIAKKNCNAKVFALDSLGRIWSLNRSGLVYLKILQFLRPGALWFLDIVSFVYIFLIMKPGIFVRTFYRRFKEGEFYL